MPEGTSETLETGKYADVKLLASGDGVNAAHVNPPKRECQWHGTVDDDHFPCKTPGETSAEFTARCLGEIRDV